MVRLGIRWAYPGTTDVCKSLGNIADEVLHEVDQATCKMPRECMRGIHSSRSVNMLPHSKPPSPCFGRIIIVLIPENRACANNESNPIHSPWLQKARIDAEPSTGGLSSRLIDSSRFPCARSFILWTWVGVSGGNSSVSESSWMRGIFRFECR